MDMLLEVNNLIWEVAGKRIVDVDHFTLSPRENIALIGENGSGKSSFVKILALLQKPTSGQIQYHKSISTVKSLAVRREISVVFQEPLLLKGTVFDNVALGLKLRKVPAYEIKEKVERWLEMFGITHLRKQNVRNLSGGENQRVSLARAMVTEPEMLILDEPFSALDAPTRAGIIQDFCEVLKTSPLATIFITHNVTEIPLLADRVCVMHGGRIVEEGTPNKILNYPENEVTAGLVGIDAVFEGVIQEEKDCLLIKSQEASLKARKQNHLPGTRVKVFLKPNMIKIGEKRDYNSFRYHIEKVYPLHNTYRLQGRSTFDFNIIVDKDNYIDNKLERGKTIDIFIPEEAIHLIRI